MHPHFGPAVSSGLNQFRLSVWGQEADFSVTVASTARDSGNTPTTTLRAGLVMGIITASSKWAQYNDGAGDGTEVARGILVHDISLLDPAGTPQDSAAVICDVGEIDVNKLIGDDAAALVDFATTALFRVRS